MLEDEEEESSNYETFPRYIYNQPQPDPFVDDSQGTKRGRDVEEEDDEEYNVNQTIIGGKSTDWIVNGIHIREHLTEYQLGRTPQRTRPDYMTLYSSMIITKIVSWKHWITILYNRCSMI